MKKLRLGRKACEQVLQHCFDLISSLILLVHHADNSVYLAILHIHPFFHLLVVFIHPLLQTHVIQFQLFQSLPVQGSLRNIRSRELLRAFCNIFS